MPMQTPGTVSGGQDGDAPGGLEGRGSEVEEVFGHA
jgi:hypothetical protein